MDFQDIKRWHWMLVGLIAGLAFSYAFSDHDVANDSSPFNREIKQPIFEREALSRSRESHEPVLQNVKVEPPVPDFAKHLQRIVRGERLQYSEKYKREVRIPFYYYAAEPYFPVTFPAGTDPAVEKSIKTVMDYLAFAQKTVTAPPAPQEAAPWQAGPAFHFRYAWEYESHWNVLLWAGGGLLLIGGIWPTFLNALVNVGLGPPPKAKNQEQDYLNRFASGADPAKPAIKVVSDSERQRLDELNAALESGLSPCGARLTGATADADGDSVAEETVARMLSSAAAVEPAADEEPELSEEERKKRFAAGDFYPVARGPAKNE